MSSRKHICVAVLAHVDAGKTTLSEAMLYQSGSIRKMGRVDNQDAFLDNYSLERERGITIFSKQAEFQIGEVEVTLLDTPGHVDFSAEMERTLQVLDYAILLVSGADGVQGHTNTLWRLLCRYQIPTMIFVNKMDQSGTDEMRLMGELKQRFGDGCVDFTRNEAGEYVDPDFFENAAMCDESALNHYLENKTLEREELCRLVSERKLFPCFFGSALKMTGIDVFLQGLATYTVPSSYGQTFAAKVFKITRDAQGNRLTHMKITGGSLKVRETISGKNGWTQKVNQIRIYSGDKFEKADFVEAGRICAVTGLTQTCPGEGLGAEAESDLPVLEPVLTFELKLPDGMTAPAILPKLRMLEEEEPQLHIVWNELLQEIQVQIMGEVQIEVLKTLILERFGVAVEFGTGKILYRETIANTVEGVGHFEPLRHYAEVHLLLEPADPGSGLHFAADCSEDILDRNWQRLILTHLAEKEHLGVLTGSPITDMKITLVTGRAHIKHTEGGDFRQATYRAIRQGLMQADSVLLEPFYDFRLELPEQVLGRAMMDIERMHGRCNPPEPLGGPSNMENALSSEKMILLTGSAPVACMRDYAMEVTAYTKGHGKLLCALKGYGPCHNAAEVIAEKDYDPQGDLANTPDSVFCAHGAGFVVSWDEVFSHMHLEPYLGRKENNDREGVWSPQNSAVRQRTEEAWIGTDEIDRILNQTYNANRRDKEGPGRNNWKRMGRAKDASISAPTTRTYQPKPTAEEYLLVDGYNVIFAWESLSELAAANIDSARGRLLDILCNYQGIRGGNLIVVFDAYRVKGHETEIYDYHNIHVVYTREAETADQYIEKFAHENGHKYRVTVATSDGLEQIIIRGAGCALLSARDLEKEIRERNEQMQEDFQSSLRNPRNYLLDDVSKETAEELSRIRKLEQ